MPTAELQIGDSFPLQFAWRLPQGDYLRAVYRANILNLVPEADKYVVRLVKLEAGRQEDEDGNLRPTEMFSRAYWSMAADLVGRKITIAYEADDGRARLDSCQALVGRGRVHPV